MRVLRLWRRQPFCCPGGCAQWGRSQPAPGEAPRLLAVAVTVEYSLHCMGAPRYDLSRWPLVVVTLSQLEMTDVELAHYLDWMDELFLRGGKFAVLLDYRQAPYMEAKRRQLIGARSKAALERHPGQLLAFAFIISSAMQRGIFTAILWLSRSGDTTRVFSSPGEGEAWLTSRLQGAGAARRIRAPGQ